MSEKTFLRAEIERLQHEIDLRVEQGKALNQDKDIFRAQVERLTQEREHFRVRVFTARCHESSTSHSTACTIWGDDGQGGTAENFGSLPCNCGALINWEKSQVAALQQQVRELRKALEDIKNAASGDPNPVTKYGAGCLCPYACPVHNTKGDDKREILNGMSGDFDWERQKAKEDKNEI